MASYPNGNTPYTFSPEINAALRGLRNYPVKIFEWFHENRFKSNVIQCITTTSKPQEEIQIGETSLASMNRVKLLCIRIGV